MTVVFRVYDDGIGFRYQLPKQEKLAHANIADELTEFVDRGTGRSLVGPGVRVEPRGICLQPHSDRAGRNGADATDRPHR